MTAKQATKTLSALRLIRKTPPYTLAISPPILCDMSYPALPIPAWYEANAAHPAFHRGTPPPCPETFVPPGPLPLREWLDHYRARTLAHQLLATTVWRQLTESETASVSVGRLAYLLATQADEKLPKPVTAELEVACQLGWLDARWYGMPKRTFRSHKEALDATLVWTSAGISALED